MHASLIMRSLMIRQGACMHASTFEVCFIYHQGLSVIALEVRSAGRTGLAHRALQRIVPHGVTAARPLHVCVRVASLPAGIACHAHHRSLLQQRLAASTPCIGSLVDSQHRLAASSRSSNRRIGSLCIGSLHRNHGWAAKTAFAAVSRPEPDRLALLLLDCESRSKIA